MKRARVLLCSDGLTPSRVALAQLGGIDDVTEAVQQALDAEPNPTICVLPQGPQTIAYTA